MAVGRRAMIWTSHTQASVSASSVEPALPVNILVAEASCTGFEPTAPMRAPRLSRMVKSPATVK